MFRKVFVEITNVCNLACSFCPPTLRPGRFLSVDQLALVLDRLAGFTTQLAFHLKGEPLLHPRLVDLLTLAHGRGFSVTLTTNGTLLGSRAEALLGAPGLRQLNISLHGQADSPDLGGYWDQVAAFLDRHAARPAMPVSLRLWSRTGGVQPPGVAELWSLVADRYPAMGGWEGAGTLDKGLRLAPGVFLNQEEAFVWPGPEAPEGPREGTCLGLRHQVGVLVDGTVVPCCLDGEGRLALGNLFEEPLDQILASPRARAIREGFRAGVRVEALCRRCGFWEKTKAGAPNQASSP